MYFKTFRALIRAIYLFLFLVFTFGLLNAVSSRAEVIDRIVAIVNEEIITLTDLNLVITFGLYESPKEERDIDNQRLQDDNKKIITMEICFQYFLHSIR